MLSPNDDSNALKLSSTVSVAEANTTECVFAYSVSHSASPTLSSKASSLSTGRSFFRLKVAAYTYRSGALSRMTSAACNRSFRSMAMDAISRWISATPSTSSR